VKFASHFTGQAFHRAGISQGKYFTGQAFHRASISRGKNSTGQVTNQCHKREFLLKFAKDRHRWLQWLFEVRRRFAPYNKRMQQTIPSANKLASALAPDPQRVIRNNRVMSPSFLLDTRYVPGYDMVA